MAAADPLLTYRLDVNYTRTTFTRTVNTYVTLSRSPSVSGQSNHLRCGTGLADGRDGSLNSVAPDVDVGSVKWYVSETFWNEI
jgi:hypothetical protein